MIPKAREVWLTPKVRKVLEARCRAPSTPQGEVKRARIVLLAADGRSTRSIAQEVGVQPRIVSKWRHRFADHGLGGLKDRPRATKPRIYGPATNTIRARFTSPCGVLGARHRASSTLRIFGRSRTSLASGF